MEYKNKNLIIFQREGLENFFKRFPPIYFNLENDFVFEWRPEDYLFEENL